VEDVVRYIAFYKVAAHAFIVSSADKGELAPNEAQLLESPRNTAGTQQMPAPSPQITEASDLMAGGGNDQRIVEERKEGQKNQGHQRNARQRSFQEPDQGNQHHGYEQTFVRQAQSLFFSPTGRFHGVRRVVEDVSPIDDGSWVCVSYPSGAVDSE